MDKIKKSKNRKKRNNRRNNKKNQLPVDETRKDQYFEATPMFSSSPRPNNLHTNCNTTRDYKRNSGSEYDDFQTPSVEYDIKKEGFDDATCGDNGSDLDKEWEELGSFKSANLTNIVEHDPNTNHKVYSKCNGTVVMDCSLNVTLVSTVSAINYVEPLQNRDETALINGDRISLELEDVDNCTTVLHSDFGDEKYEAARQINFNDDLIEEVTLMKVDGIDLNDKEHENMNYLNEEDDGEINEEKFIMYVNQFYEDIGEHGFDYPQEEIITKCDCEEPIQNDSINSDSFTLPFHHQMDCTETNLGILSKEKVDTEHEAVDDEMLNLICTEENLLEETLEAKCFSLDITYELIPRKPMTLNLRPQENSFKQSATSITNVTSISDDNIPLSVDIDSKVNKKNKRNTYTMCKNFIYKFKKAKTPEKESLKKEPSQNNLSLRSQDIIKNSEIESNQSLKSINNIDNNSQIFPLSDINKPNVHESKVATSDDKPIEFKSERSSASPKKQCEETTKSDKTKSFIHKLKMTKQKYKKEPEVQINGDLNHEKIEVISLKENVVIENETIEEFNKAIKSLIDTNVVPVTDVCVKRNNDGHINIDTAVINSVSVFQDYNEEESDDHLFPDAITATKILGLHPVDVPYMDDPVVSKLDYITFYNGESKKIRISPEFFVSKASMETLYFPGDSISQEMLQKPTISHSPRRRKRVISNFLGFMTKGR